MFSPQGPTVRELAVQALSSVEHGYDLLAPKFDHTPFRTPRTVLDAVADALEPLGPFDNGLDLCCGTGAGMSVLHHLCQERATGVDFSASMLSVGQQRHTTPHRDRPPHPRHTPHQNGHRTPATDWVRADARALPFRRAFDLIVSFGAFGHFLPEERPALFAEAHAALRPGGKLAFPIAAPPRPSSAAYWALLAFDSAMRLRNAVWRPRFVMYYRTFRLIDVRSELRQAGFTVDLHDLPLGQLPDGRPRCRLVTATHP